MIAKSPDTKTVRCAIYTRKSTDEGLEKEFNSLDAQRESAEAYIKSQAHSGWIAVADHYDDGGFTGGNMDRPALKRLLADIEAGRIDCLVIYKVDRLSRSLLDFARIIEILDQHKVSFVSVTQQFNTASSMGRLILNVLLSFAQFEREIISERTRDKMAAARRRGKWTGGPVPLGYNLKQGKLFVNGDEADQVRQIFSLYRAQSGLVATVRELDRRGWRNKRGISKTGQPRGGRPFTKTSLYQLLTNPIYLGQVRYKHELHQGEHPAIIEANLWREVQLLLKERGQTERGQPRNRSQAVLKGILCCGACGCAMSPAHSTRSRNRRYRYYVCSNAQKRGWDICPVKSVPAYPIEQFVVERLRAASGQSTSDQPEELASFDRVWGTLDRKSQVELLDRLIERLEYDGQELLITFRPAEHAQETTLPGNTP